jgi:hypothetical protein
MFELHNSQKFMYFGYKQGAGQALLLCGSIVIPRKIDIEQLQNAANELFRINNGLRTYFIEKDGKVYQDVKPFEKKKFEVLHFNSKEELDEYGKVYGTIPLKLDIRVDGDKPFKAETEKPSLELVKNVIVHEVKMFFTKLRMGMLKRDKGVCEVQIFELPESVGMILKITHIVADAWTVMLLANQFMSILNGKDVEAFDYQEFVENDKKYRLNKRYERDKEYNLEEYNKCPEQTWVWPEPYTSLEASRRTVVLDKEFTAEIKKFCETNNVTPYILFLTATCLYINRKTQREKFYVGSVALNRSNYREKNTAGMFVTSIPVLIELDKEDSYSVTLNKIKDKSLRGFKHSKGILRNDDSRKILYDMWISYQNATLDADSTVDCTQYYCNYVVDTTILSIEDRAMDGQYKLHFDHNCKVPEKDVDELFDSVISNLHKIMDNPDSTIGK